MSEDSDAGEGQTAWQEAIAAVSRGLWVFQNPKGGLEMGETQACAWRQA